MNIIDSQLKREARWTAMCGLYHASSIGLNESMLGRIFGDMHYSLSISETRNILLYLAELGFCVLERLPEDRIWAKITAKGVDLYEFNCPCPESIARPNTKYWS